MKSSTELELDYFLNENSELEIHKEFEIKNRKIEETTFIKIKDIVDLNFTRKQSIRTISKEYKKHKNKKLNGYKLKKHTNNVSQEILKKLPLYFLFQSDKVNKDTDEDIQKILRQMTKNLEEELQDKVEELKENLETELKEIGESTIKKMEEIGLDTPKNIIPKVIPKNLDSFFSFNLESEDISLNKRGSGFRRMITLNYLRAEIEKEKDKEEKNIIYAIEEPKTAQHPNNQKKIMKSLIKLSEKEKYQIIITTHIPEIAKMVKKEENLILINRDNDKNSITINDDENKLDLIIKTLGVLPSLDIKNIQKIKVVVCFEGYTDIEFIKNINQNIPEFKNIIDISDDSILMLPLGGGTIEHYVNNKYLDKLNIPQIHIYDSDINQKLDENKHKYKKYIKIINKRNNNYACETNKAEMENYLHPDIIKEEYNFDTIYHSNDNDNWLKKWSEELDMNKYVKENKKNNNKSLKTRFPELSKKLTKKHLEELEAFDEIKGWFEKIRELKEY